MAARQTAAEARYRRILALRRPRESFAALAERCGVNYQTLSWWKWQIGVRDRAESSTLLPVKVAEQSHLASLLPFMRSEPLEVVLRHSGHLVRVSAGFDPVTFTRVVDALEGRAE